MSLEADRNKTLELVRAAAPDDEILKWAEKWFKSYKDWEKEETFERAFADNRMTGRMADREKTLEFKVSDSGHTSQANMKVNLGVAGLEGRLNPQNFLDKKKNELGLHDLSAVLLRGDKPISKQLFTRDAANKYAVFMPLPLEEDLQLFEELSQAAKRQRGGKLYPFVVNARAQFTRIKYGSADDMAVGYLNVNKGDGKAHIRYGGATASGGAVSSQVLQQRSANALHYKNKIALAIGNDANNEVTIKYRQHAGGFPFFGKPSKGGYAGGLAGANKAAALSDEGKLTFK
jgi:hypothetical protein